MVKSANLLFSTLEPSYVWIHCGFLFEKACQARIKTQCEIKEMIVKSIGCGMPNLIEICILTEFLLDTVSLDTFIDTPSDHLPTLFYNIISKLLCHIDLLSCMEISKSLQLCAKILSKVQPTVVTTQTDKREIDAKLDSSQNNATASSNDNSLIAIPLEKSQSDSKLNKADTMNSSYNEKSPNLRRRANSGGTTKRIEKKSKKKGSRSISKLNDASVTQTDNINVSMTEDFKLLSRNKSMENIQTDSEETEKNAPEEKSIILNHNFVYNYMDSTNSSIRETSSAFQAQHSMLEKCLRQYEIFYVKLISNRVLSKEKTVQNMFDSLLISCPRESFNERMHYLELLLNSRLNLEDSGFFSQDVSVVEDIKCFDILHSYTDIIAQSEWEESVKIASTLLVELSTFPKYFLSGDGLLLEDEPKGAIVLPDWLKVLIVCACWLGKQPTLQLTSIATLLDLIALLKAHSDIEIYPKTGEGVTTVIMIPLLKQWHITYLIQYTNVFQVSITLII